RTFDDVGEAIEPLQPGADALEGVGHERASPGTADLLRGDEVRILEQPDVLLHSSQRHAEGLGELADRRAARAEPFEHGAAGWVSEGCEGAVDGRRMLNHWVQYCRSSAAGAPHPPRTSRTDPSRAMDLVATPDHYQQS